MADDFKLTPDIEGFSSALSQMDKSTLEANRNFIQFNASMQDFSGTLGAVKLALADYADITAKMGNAEIVSNQDLANMSQLKDLLMSVGVSHKTINKAVEQAVKLHDKEIVQYEKLTYRQRQFVEAKKKELEAAKKVMEINGKFYEMNIKGNAFQQSATYAVGKRAWGGAKSVASAAGIPTSILGMLSFLADKAFFSRMRGAMGMQLSQQWLPGTKSGVGASNVYYSQYAFKKGIQGAGQYQMQLDKAGLGKIVGEQGKNRLGAAQGMRRGIEAQDILYGYGGASHVSDMLGLINESTDLLIQKEEKKGDLANQYLKDMTDLSKLIPNMTMDEVRDQFVELGTSVKSFNTSLMHTKMLMLVMDRQDLAKDIFGVEAPLSVRKGLASEIARQPESMQVAVQAEIAKKIIATRMKGRPPGEISAALNKMNISDLAYFFRGETEFQGKKANPFERFQGGLQFAAERFGDDRLRLSMGLQQVLGYSQPTSEYLAKSLSDPATRKKALSGNLPASVAGGMEQLEAEAKKKQISIDRAEELRKAKMIADQLQPFETWLKNRIEKFFDDLMATVTQKWQEFMDMLPTFGASDSRKDIKKSLVLSGMPPAAAENASRVLNATSEIGDPAYAAFKKQLEREGFAYGLGSMVTPPGPPGLMGKLLPSPSPYFQPAPRFREAMGTLSEAEFSDIQGKMLSPDAQVRREVFEVLKSVLGKTNRKYRIKQAVDHQTEESTAYEITPRSLVPGKN
jgi:hypothetical protein